MVNNKFVSFWLQHFFLNVETTKTWVGEILEEYTKDVNGHLRRVCPSCIE